MVEKLERLTKEHLLKVANEGTSSSAWLRQRIKLNGSSIRYRLFRRALLTLTHSVHLNHVLRRVWIPPVLCFWF